MINFSLKNSFNNLLFVSGSQLLVLIISVIRSLILPLFLTVDSYGYWQIYLFYSAYVGVFALGFNDGIYLRYGNKDYYELPFIKLRTSIRIFSLILLVFTISTVFLSYVLNGNDNIRFALIFSSLNIFVIGLTGFFSHVFQITNQFKKYSLFSVADKALVILTVALMFLLNNYDFKVIIVIDFLAKVLIVLLMANFCKELLIGKITSYKLGFKELKNNISDGVKLLVANILGMLIIGMGRFLVQFFGNIEDFANYSFGITISGFVIIAVSAFSIVLYPTIKRLDKNNYKKYFQNINSFVSAFNFSTLLLYFPTYLFVIYFYSDFTEMLSYLNLLFVITILQSKMSILNNTFYKLLRKEREMLIINLCSIFLFIFLSPLLFYFTISIWNIAFISVVTMMIRSYASEIYLKNYMQIQFDYKLIIEVIIIILFIVTSTLMNPKHGTLIYFLLLTFWVTLNFSDLKKLSQIFLSK